MKKKDYSSGLMIAVLGLFTLFLSSCAATMGGVVMDEIEIDAPVEEVFAYIADPANMPDYVPGCVSVSNIKGQGLGMTFDWALEGNGSRLEGRMVVTDYAPNERVVLNSTCGKIITVIVRPTPEGGARLVYSIVYSSEVPVEGKAVKKTVVNITEGFLAGILANVKEKMER